MTFTQRMLTLLRDRPIVEQTLPLVEATTGLEVGKIGLALKLDPSGIENEVEEDVRKIEKDYYDPMIDDQATIKKRLAEIKSQTEPLNALMAEPLSERDRLYAASNFPG